jgi:hypothetical protein
MASVQRVSLVVLATAIAAMAALVLVLYLLPSPSPGSSPASSPPSNAKSGVATASELAAAGVEAGRSQEEASTAIKEPEAVAPPPSVEASKPDAGEATIWGYVRESQSGAGIADCTVRVGPAAPVHTDATGAFTLQLDSQALDSEFQSARVEHGERELLFNGSVRVQPGMEILVRPAVVLRGRITNSAGEPLRARGVTASLVPERLRAIEWFLASSDQVTADGRFEIHARSPSERPHLLDLRIGLGATLARAVVEWDALLSDEGATVVLDFCPVRLSIVEADGSTPVAASELRLSAWVGQDGEPAARVYQDHAQPAGLELELPSAATSIEVAIGAPGFAPFVAQRDATPCGETWTLALAPLGPDDVLAGIVVDAEGRPVSGAYASCNPATRDPEVGVAANSGVRTDPEGRFELAFPAGRTAQLRAYHRDHGMTPEELVAGGQREIVLRFLGVQDLEVDARLPGSAGVAENGHPFEWVLALQGGDTLSGSERIAPFTIEEVPPGDHRLYVVAVGGKWFSSEPVSLYPSLDARVELELRPARHVRGHLLDAAGMPAGGVALRVVDPNWPAELASKWSSGSTDREGAFELLAGDAAECELAIERNGVELLRQRVASETPLEIRLP